MAKTIADELREFAAEVRQNAEDDRKDWHENYARISDIYAKRLDEVVARLDGMAVVPIEPTQAMLSIGSLGGATNLLKTVWRKMVAAAQENSDAK